MEIDKTEKKSLLKLVDSAIIIFIVSTIFILLSFSFNCGYNSYFGIPLMFTNASWSALIFRIPQLSDIILIIAVACTIIAFGINLVKPYLERKLADETTNISPVVLIVIVILFIFEIASFWAFLIKKQIILLAMFILVLMILVVMLIVYINMRRVMREISKMGKKYTDTSVDVNNGNKSAPDSKKRIRVQELLK